LKGEQMATVTKPIALDESINTTEQTPRNIADVLAEELKGIADNILPPNASRIAYDNTASGLTATNVQDAIDEVISSQADVIADTMADLTENKTATVTDGVADFETIDGSLVKSLVVSIEPSQSGYTQEDVTVVGKNRQVLTVEDIKSLSTSVTWVGNSCVLNGITYTILTNSNNEVVGIKTNGTASTSSQITISKTYVKEGSYTFSSGVVGSNSTYYTRYVVRNSNGTAIPIDGSVFLDIYNIEITKALPSNASYVNGYINVVNGVQANNLVFKPMIRLASETDSTFEPYHGKTYTTTFGQSITAGGTLDFLTGELTTGGSTISLTPQTVKSLVGENHIMASTGDVTECKFSMLINGDDLAMLLS